MLRSGNANGHWQGQRKANPSVLCTCQWYWCTGNWWRWGENVSFDDSHISLLTAMGIMQGLTSNEERLLHAVLLNLCVLYSLQFQFAVFGCKVKRKLTTGGLGVVKKKIIRSFFHLIKAFARCWSEYGRNWIELSKKKMFSWLLACSLICMEETEIGEWLQRTYYKITCTTQTIFGSLVVERKFYILDLKIWN